MPKRVRQELNGIYREVLYITGVAPDQFRDYQIESYLPGLEDELIHAQGILQQAIDGMVKSANGIDTRQISFSVVEFI